MSRSLTVVRLAKTMEIVLAEFGLTMNQYRMLTFIDAGAPSLREVGKRLVMKRPNVSVLIDGLVERGWVRRSRSEADGRRIELELTGKGQQLLSSCSVGPRTRATRRSPGWRAMQEPKSAS
jgi:DNA-binding MarR family transcriptional regulator